MNHKNFVQSALVGLMAGAVSFGASLPESELGAPSGTELGDKEGCSGKDGCGGKEGCGSKKDKKGDKKEEKK